MRLPDLNKDGIVIVSFLPAVLMEGATTTTPTLSSEVVIESYRWTFMFQVNYSSNETIVHKIRVFQTLFCQNFMGQFGAWICSNAKAQNDTSNFIAIIGHGCTCIIYKCW